MGLIENKSEISKDCVRKPEFHIQCADLGLTMAPDPNMTGPHRKQVAEGLEEFRIL